MKFLTQFLADRKLKKEIERAVDETELQISPKSVQVKKHRESYRVDGMAATISVYGLDRTSLKESIQQTEMERKMKTANSEDRYQGVMTGRLAKKVWSPSELAKEDELTRAIAKVVASPEAPPTAEEKPKPKVGEGPHPLDKK